MIRIPPINLYSYREVVYLLTQFPLLAGAGVEKVARLYYNQRFSGQYATTSTLKEVESNERRV